MYKINNYIILYNRIFNTTLKTLAFCFKNIKVFILYKLHFF